MTKIAFTKGAQILKRKYGVAEPEYLVYADLVACGWDRHDAWFVAFQNTGLTWQKEQLLREMNKLDSLVGVQKRIADIKEPGKERRKKNLSAEELARETSKEKILSDLVLAKSKQTPGSKEWNETVKMIADYNKIKQDEIKDDDNTIHYHLPVNYPNRCEECLIWQNGKAKGQENN